MDGSLGAPTTCSTRSTPSSVRSPTALRGPVRVLAGAGTGKTRAITHRIAYGVATGALQPDRGPRGHLHHAGGRRDAHPPARAGRRRRPGPHLPLRRAAPGALLLAPGLRRHAARADRVEDPDRRRRRPAQPGRGRPGACCATSPARSSGPRSATSAPTTTSGSPPPAAARSAGSTPATVGARLRQLRGAQARPGPDGHGGRPALRRRRCSARTSAVAAEVRRQYKWFVVDEFQDVSPIQSALLDLWLGGRDEICVVGDPAQTIYSFAGAQADYLRRLHHQVPGRDHVELVRNYRSTPQVITRRQRPARRHADARASTAARPAPPASPVRWHEATDEVAEADAVAEDRRRLHAAGTPLREMAVLFRINAQSEAFEEALTARGIPYVVRGAARFFERQEVRQALALMRGEVRAGEAGADGAARPGARPSCPGWAGRPRRPPPVARPATAGSRCRRWSPRPTDFASSEPWRHRSAGFVAELDRRAARAARAASPRASPWPPCTPPRAWSGTPSSCAACRRASMPITYADTPAAVEEERRLLYPRAARRRPPRCTRSDDGPHRRAGRAREHGAGERRPARGWCWCPVLPRGSGRPRAAACRRHSTGRMTTASLHPASSCRTLGGLTRRLAACRLCNEAGGAGGVAADHRRAPDPSGPDHRAGPGITQPALRRPFAGDAGAPSAVVVRARGLDDEETFRAKSGMTAVRAATPAATPGARRPPAARPASSRAARPGPRRRCGCSTRRCDPRRRPGHRRAARPPAAGRGGGPPVRGRRAGARAAPPPLGRQRMDERRPNRARIREAVELIAGRGARRDMTAAGGWRRSAPSGTVGPVGTKGAGARGPTRGTRRRRRRVIVVALVCAAASAAARSTPARRSRSRASRARRRRPARRSPSRP